MEHAEQDDFLPEFAELELDEIEELLEELGLDLADDELHQVALFMKQSGSLEAGFAALAELENKAA